MKVKRPFWVRVKGFVGRAACFLGWHSWCSTTLERWKRDKTNFECIRCGVGVRRAGDALGFRAPNSE
jgi:hypothetical protein